MRWAWACGAYGREGFWWGNLSVRYHLDDLDLDGRISIKTDLEK